MNTSANIANIITLAGLAAIAYMLHRKNGSDDPSTIDVSPTTPTTYPNPNGASRGLRNNNPLNIEYSKNTIWQGEIRPSSDPRFAQFESLPYGYRAAFRTLNTYMTKYGLSTLTEIISRWDNAGRVPYINFICEKTGWSPTKAFTPSDHIDLVKLVYNMSWLENGVKPSLFEVNDGWKLYQTV